MKFLINIFLLFISVNLFAQNNANVIVHAKVVDENNNFLPYVDIANRRLQLGFSSDKNGLFTTTIRHSDSLILLKKGYLPGKFSLRDSVVKNEYFVTIQIIRVPIELNEVQIKAIRKHDEIRKDITQLKVKQTDVNPDAKPIQNALSFLYEMFSKKEKQNRLAAKLETEEMKRVLLKDLFKLYGSYDIIKIKEEDYDEFITYLNIPYTQMQQLNDYELALDIKKAFYWYNKERIYRPKREIYPAALDDLEKIKRSMREER